MSKDNELKKDYIVQVAITDVKKRYRPEKYYVSFDILIFCCFSTVCSCRVGFRIIKRRIKKLRMVQNERSQRAI